MVPRARPIRDAFVRGLFLACVILLGRTSYTALTSARSMGESAVSVLLPTALALGTGGMVLGDRHPRLRWALLIAVGVLLILVFLLQSHVLSV